MKLVILYGPPGVGKLTVGKELAKLTGYKLFHNHLTLDMVGAVFNRPGRTNLALVDRYRKEMVGIAARSGIEGMIFTYAYAPVSADDRFLKGLAGVVKKRRGQVYFVQLVCDIRELGKRLKSKERKSSGKITDMKTLLESMGRDALFATAKFSDSMKIDNSRRSPGEVARMIRSYYRI